MLFLELFLTLQPCLPPLVFLFPPLLSPGLLVKPFLLLRNLSPDSKPLQSQLIAALNDIAKINDVLDRENDEDKEERKKQQECR